MVKRIIYTILWGWPIQYDRKYFHHKGDTVYLRKSSDEVCKPYHVMAIVDYEIWIKPSW